MLCFGRDIVRLLSLLLSLAGAAEDAVVAVLEVFSVD